MRNFIQLQALHFYFCNYFGSAVESIENAEVISWSKLPIHTKQETVTVTTKQLV
jgi:hypothetical protein